MSHFQVFFFVLVMYVQETIICCGMSVLWSALSPHNKNMLGSQGLVDTPPPQPPLLTHSTITCINLNCSLTGSAGMLFQVIVAQFNLRLPPV